MQDLDSLMPYQQSSMEEPNEEELNAYKLLMEKQILEEGKKLRDMIEPSLHNQFAPFEDQCLGIDILTAYQENDLPPKFIANVQQHIVCCLICIDDLSFIE